MGNRRPGTIVQFLAGPSWANNSRRGCSTKTCHKRLFIIRIRTTDTQRNSAFYMYAVRLLRLDRSQVPSWPGLQQPAPTSQVPLSIPAAGPAAAAAAPADSAAAAAAAADSVAAAAVAAAAPLMATVICESSGTARKGSETQGKAVITAF
eukprot:SAG22_NODE_1479_length_4327_cov_1.368496_5_plen_150_part_00